MFAKPSANLIPSQDFPPPPLAERLLLSSASMATCRKELGLITTENFLV